MNVMKNEMMSSEESDLEDPDVMVIHPLTWRSEYVSKMFAQIDRYTEARKSPQARRQMKKRVTGHPSKQSCPSDIPSWAQLK